MRIFAIYFNPSDYPGKYVLREWAGRVPNDECKLADTLEDIRKEIPPGLTQMPLFEGDDPKIIETWA